MDLPDIDSLWDYRDPAASERAFQQALPLARNTGNAEYLAQLLTQLARSQVLQRRYQQATVTLDEVAAILTRKTPVARVRYLLERGRLWNDTGRLEDARGVFQLAYRLALNRFDALAVDAAHMLGVMEPHQDAVEWNRRALLIAEQSGEQRARRWIGTLWINLGWILQRLGDFPAAEVAFKRAIPALQEIGSAERVRSARVALARNMRLRGDPAAALAALEPLLVEIRSADEPAGYSLEEIAECLLALGRDGDAKAFFSQAYVALSTYAWFPPGEAARLQRLRDLGGVD
jgi:tetratricopeptide (TPR) repeat protein